MVGVPGQSKGCNTCRRRKKGCDLQRPQCGQCKRLGYVCEGYERDRIFVNQGSYGRKTSQGLKRNAEIPPSAPSPDSTSANTVISKNSPRSEYHHVPDSWRYAPPFSEATSISLATASPPKLFSSISDTSVYRTQFFSLFWDDYLPDRQLHPTSTWMEAVPELRSSDPALNSACSALSIARVGQINRDKRLTRESLRLYGAGLQRLQAALWDEKRMYSDETLAASLLLALYEVLECRIEKGYAWMSHTAGASRLVKLRGPSMHISEQAHKLFLGIRVTSLTNAVTSREATFLAEEEWLTIPFQGHTKNIQHQLIDVMLQIPTVLEEADSVAADQRPLKRISRTVDLITQCNAIDDRLSAWHTVLLAKTNDNPYWHEPTGPNWNPPTDTKPATSLHFPNLLIANTMNLYWTAQQLLYGTMFWLYKSLPVDLDKSTLRAMESSHSVRQAALNILLSMEYFLRPEMRHLGPNLTLFPLRVAMQFFVYFPGRELGWCRDMFSRLTDLGFPFGAYLAQTKPKNWPSARDHFGTSDGVYRENFREM